MDELLLYVLYNSRSMLGLRADQRGGSGANCRQVKTYSTRHMDGLRVKGAHGRIYSTPPILPRLVKDTQTERQWLFSILVFVFSKSVGDFAIDFPDPSGICDVEITNQLHRHHQLIIVNSARH